MVRRPWVTFFSQTGSEIADLSEKLGRWPDLIITNQRPENLRTIDKRIEKHGFITTKNKPTTDDLELLLNNFNNPFITLHGWLRIMPPEICSKYTIFNGHPGLITKYPELKGKDPQIRAFLGDYPQIGGVLHRVTKGVDEGAIIAVDYFDNDKLTLDEVFLKLKKSSLFMWYNLLTTVLDD